MKDFKSKLDGKVSFQKFKSFMVKILEKHSSEPCVTKINVYEESEGEEENLYSNDSMFLSSEHD